MNILHIDTRDNQKNIVFLSKDSKRYTKTSEKENIRAEITLQLIEEVLHQAKISLDEVDEIEVELGPGSFTGLRVGASIANALSFALKRPINKEPVGSSMMPFYE